MRGVAGNFQLSGVCIGGHYDGQWVDAQPDDYRTIPLPTGPIYVNDTVTVEDVLCRLVQFYTPRPTHVTPHDVEDGMQNFGLDQDALIAGDTDILICKRCGSKQPFPDA